MSIWGSSCLREDFGSCQLPASGAGQRLKSGRALEFLARSLETWVLTGEIKVPGQGSNPRNPLGSFFPDSGSLSRRNADHFRIPKCRATSHVATWVFVLGNMGWHFSLIRPSTNSPCNWGIAFRHKSPRKGNTLVKKPPVQRGKQPVALFSRRAEFCLARRVLPGG